MFTRSAVTPPKVNRLGWNLQHCEYIVEGWSWQILGAIRLVATIWEARENSVFFCPVNTSRFRRFPVGQTSRNLNATLQQRRSVRRWKLSGQNFENFTARSLFSKKRKHFSQFQRIANSSSYNYAIITDYRKFTTKWSLYRMSSFHFHRWINSRSFLWAVCAVQKRTHQFFGDVKRPFTSYTTRHVITSTFWVGVA